MVLDWKLFILFLFNHANANSRNRKLKKPNIILLVTDDQDVQMKSELIMEQTQKLIIGINID